MIQRDHTNPPPLQNLIGNAVKFSKDNGAIEIKSWNKAGPNAEQLCVQVVDHGIGIDSSALPKLFSAFEQASQEITRSFGGLGLGLVISKTLATLHGGTIEAESRGRDQGASFTLTLPLSLSPPPAPTTPSLLTAPPLEPLHRTPSVTPKPFERSLQLLLVEDNQVTVAVMERVLRHLGHSVRTATSCQEARRVAGESGAVFDVLLCDIALPDGTGNELLPHLRQLQPNMRAIALTGFGREEEVKRTYDAGFMLHLTKPVRLKQLTDAIVQVMTAPLR